MDLFLEDRDRIKYYDILDEVREKYKCDLYAYCLMSNHVHLLIKENDSPVSGVMKSIGIRFAAYVNKKYGRIGNLHQNRFRSEVISSDSHLLTCARYIHANPVKAGIADRPEDYLWSSYRAYLGLAKESILDKDFLLGLYQNDLIEFRNFTRSANTDRFMEYDQEEVPQENDKLQAIEDFLEVNYGLKPREIQYLAKKSRDSIIKEIKANIHVSDRELAKLLGLEKDKVHRT